MADEAVGADLAPRDGDERTEKAVEAMVVMGLERDLVIRTLKRLYKVSSSSNSSVYVINDLHDIVLGTCTVEHLHRVLHR